jgi:hypothetical protein
MNKRKYNTDLRYVASDLIQLLQLEYELDNIKTLEDLSLQFELIINVFKDNKLITPVMEGKLKNEFRIMYKRLEEYY